MSRLHDSQEPPDLASMVAIAAGKTSRVTRWAAVLDAAAILAAVSHPCDRDDHAELWVSSDDAEEARSALSRAGQLNW
jgi:hypothetical protein